MAAIVFSGGQVLETDAPATEVVQGLSSEDGFVLGRWVTLDTPEGALHINPEQIAFITDAEIDDEEEPDLR